MRILILIFMFNSIVSAIGTQDYEGCCSSWGRVYAGQGGSTPWISPDLESGNKVTEENYCKNLGLGDFQVTRYESYYNFTRSAKIQCSCNKEDIPIEPPAPNASGTWKLFGTEDCNSSNIDIEAYHALTVPIAETTGLIDCCSKKSYWYLDIKKPKYDCKVELGDEWTDSEDETLEECNGLIPDFASSTSFLTSNANLPTCCFIPYDNTPPPTDNNSTPPTDKSLSEGIKSLDSNNQSRHEEIEEHLNDIKNEINSSNNASHQDLEDLKGILRGDDNNNTGLDSLAKSYSDILTDGYSTITQKFNSLSNVTFGSVPALKHSVGSCVFTLNITYGSYLVDLHEYTRMIKPYTTLLFSLIFIWISIRWWLYSFNIILKAL
jgi:hypothetical protein